MTITFAPAVRANVPLLIGLDGASGSGKTYSAQLLAKGIAEEIGRAQGREGRVFGLDTERRRMLHYADDFRFMHGEINPPFEPKAYADGISAAERAGADVIIIDSFSHEWEGEGGVREWAQREEAGGKKPPANWMAPKLAHQRLVNQMLASPAHIIVCLRSQEKMKIEAVPQFESDGVTPKMWRGKQSTKMEITAAADLPLLERWAAICEKRFPFEITTSLLLTPDAPGVPHPRKLQRQHRPFFPDGQAITADSGRMLAAWAMGAKNAAPAADEGLTEAEVRRDLAGAAELGRRALETEWKRKTTGPHRQALAGLLEDLKRRADQVDQASRAPESTGGEDGYVGA